MIISRWKTRTWAYSKDAQTKKQICMNQFTIFIIASIVTFATYQYSMCVQFTPRITALEGIDATQIYNTAPVVNITLTTLSTKIKNEVLPIATPTLLAGFIATYVVHVRPQIQNNLNTVEVASVNLTNIQAGTGFHLQVIAQPGVFRPDMCLLVLRMFFVFMLAVLVQKYVFWLYWDYNSGYDCRARLHFE